MVSRTVNCSEDADFEMQWEDAQVCNDWSSEEWGNEYLSLTASERVLVHIHLRDGWAYGRSVPRDLQGWLPPSFVLVDVPVEVSNMVGDLIKLNLDWMTCIQMLKGYVEKEWGIPILCQKLVCGNLVLSDDLQLASLNAQRKYARATLPITLVTSLDVVRTCLESEFRDWFNIPGLLKHSKECSDAVDAAQVMADRGDPSAIQCLRQCLWHRDYDVKYEAAMSLSSILPPGDEDLLTCLTNLVRDANMKPEWVCALIDVAPPGHAAAIRALMHTADRRGHKA